MAAYIGISGWRYASWRGRFYPEGLAHKRELEFAASRFATIELNGTFYSLQRPESYACWYGAVPRGFVFAIKGSRYITHMLRLRGVETALANLFASGLFELEEKLGPFLWQLPPTLAYEPDRLRAFFELLPRTAAAAEALARGHDARVSGRARVEAGNPAQELRHAIEIRHDSFVSADFVELLRREQIGLVIADTARKWPILEDLTADFVYVRLHGGEKIYESGYTDRVLDEWAKRIQAWLGGGEAEGARTAGPPPRPCASRDVYVYFDNDVKAHAPFDALRLARKVARARAA